MQSIQAVDGALTRPAAGDREDVAIDWVRAYRAGLGLTATDVDGLDLAARSTSAATGFTHLRYRQADRGIPAFDGGVRVSLDRGGRILSATASPAPQVDSAAPRLGPVEALRELQRDVGVERAVPVVDGPTGVRRTTRFAGGDFARLVLFGSGRGTRLAWHLTYRAGDAAHYDAVVDATSGAVLFRQNLVKHAALADVFLSHPGGPMAHNVDLQARDWLDAGVNVLNGQYAHVYSDLNDNDAFSASEEIPRTAGSFEFLFEDFDGPGCEGVADCSWDPIVANSWQDNRKQNGVQAFYLVNHFRDHLANPNIGFMGFSDADAVLVETDDGAAINPGRPNEDHLNNASMVTLPEGIPPRMQLFLFAGLGFRNVNGGDSAAIVWHEYTHGLSNRLVVHDDGSGAVSSAQAGAMGEGWSDWYALDLLVAENPAFDTATAGDVNLGHYVELNNPHLVRREGIDCPVGLVSSRCPAGGYTYGDFTGTSAHDDGEIWAQTLWDLRAAVGRNVSQRLITEGMRMAPPEPSFLDMRNAILAADAGLGGASRNAIWQVFAGRGMGYRAQSNGPNDVTPTEDFSTPPNPPPNLLPTGSLAASRTQLTVGRSVEFAASFTDDSRIVGFDWDFDGDGAADRSTAESTTSFTYSRAGVFNATVAVRDDRGGSGTAMRAITVTPTLRPAIRVPRRGRRGKLTARVTCAERCAVTARLRVGGRTVRTVRRTIRTTRQRWIDLALPRKARRAALRRDRRTLRARVTVRVRYGDGRSATARRTVRIAL